jgi:hypothetical protein
MSLLSAPAQSALSPHSSEAADTRLRGPWLAVARAGVLALAYFGAVLVLQTLVSGVTGRIVPQSPLAIVASTLAIAALFQPLRRRIQAFIYRRRYDAARTVEAFGATLHSEVDLGTLHERLIQVVQETMQPPHVSLWLRQPERTAAE